MSARSRASVVGIEELEPLPAPSLPSAWLARHPPQGPWRRARIEVDFPLANIGHNLPTLASTVAGNLFDLGETTGLRLERLAMPRAFRDRFRAHLAAVLGDDGPVELSRTAAGYRGAIHPRTGKPTPIRLKAGCLKYVRKRLKRAARRRLTRTIAA